MSKEIKLEARQPKVDKKRRLLAMTAGVLALISSANCASPTQSQENKASTLVEEAAEYINGRYTLPIVPGALISDGGVRLRKSPVKLDTVNTALKDGNNYFPADRAPFGLLRGIAIYNPDQVKRSDPKQWVAGNIGDNLVMFGVSEETCQQLTYWAKPNTNKAEFNSGGLDNLYNNADVEVGKKGLTISPDGYEKSVGLFYLGSEGVSKLEQILEIQGYQPEPLC